jgi:hypothetical protein
MKQKFQSLFLHAQNGLVSNIIVHEDGIFLQAGNQQFASFWTRDFCWSVPGLLSI